MMNTLPPTLHSATPEKKITIRQTTFINFATKNCRCFIVYCYILWHFIHFRGFYYPILRVFFRRFVRILSLTLSLSIPLSFECSRHIQHDSCHNSAQSNEIFLASPFFPIAISNTYIDNRKSTIPFRHLQPLLL